MIEYTEGEIIPGSANGRPPGSGPGNLRSNRSPGAMNMFLFIAIGAAVLIGVGAFVLFQAEEPADQGVLQSQEPPASSEEDIPVPAPSHREAFALHSGVHRNTGVKEVAAFAGVVESPGAPWLRLLFANYNLGEKSYVTITSRKDGSSQRMDANALAAWKGATALFNGDALDVELTVAPGESGIFFQVEEILVGDFLQDERRP